MQEKSVVKRKTKQNKIKLKKKYKNKKQINKQNLK